MSMNTRAPARPATPAVTPRPRRMTLASVTRAVRPEPDRIFIYGVEKIGKSTFAASAPAPVFISAENGLAEIVPAPARFPEVRTFQDVLDAIDELTTGDHPYQTLAIDSMDWVAALVQADVCARNRWSSEDFDKFGRGHKVAMEEWRKLVAALERLQNAKGMEVILIAHAEQKNFDDPLGSSFVRFQPKMGGSVAPALFKEWAKSVLFARHEYVVREADGFGRNKGITTGRRVIYTTWSAAYDAGSRHGLPAELPLDYVAYAEARAAGQPASPEVLTAEIQTLVEQLAPTAEGRAAIGVRLAGSAGDSTKLAQLANVLRERLAQKQGAEPVGAATTEEGTKS